MLKSVRMKKNVSFENFGKRITKMSPKAYIVNDSVIL